MAETKGEPVEKEPPASMATGPVLRAKKLLWAITAAAAVSCTHQPATPAMRTAYIEVNGMVQQLGIT